MIKRAYGVFSDFKWRMVIVIALGIIGIVLFSLMPTYLNAGLEQLETSMLGGGVMSDELSFIIWMLAIFVVLMIVNEVFAIVCTFLIMGYEAKAIQKFTVTVKQKLDVVPTRYLEKQNTGELTRIVCYNTPDMVRQVLFVTYQIARALFFFATTAIAMFGINTMLAFVVIASFPLCVLVARFVTKRTQKYFHNQNVAFTELNTYMDQRISLHGFYREHGLDTDTATFNNKALTHKKYQAGEQVATALNTIYITFIRNFMFLLITVLCCVMFLQGHIVIAALPAFILFSQRFLDNTVIVTNAANVLQVMGARAKRVYEVLDSGEDVTQKENIHIDKIKGDIEFKNVGLLDDDGAELLGNISFKIQQGQSVGIIGPTGAGKHLVTELMSKMGNPTSGKITIDGVDISEIKSNSFYRRMGIASDKPFIFRGTVAENILYGVGRSLPENVMNTTKLLGSHAFIEQLPKGYETEINANTGILSISQKQAINVARTVLQSPDLVIIDSALSMSDNITEKEIFEKISKIDKNQTKVFVTQRPDSVRHCDLIIYMEKGKIKEKGTHAELMKKQGKYYKLLAGV